MYQVDEKIFHLMYGICSIIDIREEKFTGNPKMYYFLHPVAEKRDCIIYTPVESQKTQIRTIYSSAQIDEIIRASKKEKVEWIDNNNLRKNTFLEILRTGNTSKIIAMLGCFYQRKELLNQQGKKLQASDEKIFNEANKKINQEFAYGLKIAEDQVSQYIKSKI